MERFAKVDRDFVSRFEFVSESRYDNGPRRYYIAKRDTGKRCLVVCQGGLSLEGLAGKTACYAVGWDDGTPQFVLGENTGKKHTKITFFYESSNAPDTTASRILARAPDFDAQTSEPEAQRRGRPRKKWLW